VLWIRIQGFDDQKLRKIQPKKKFIFFDKKFQFTYTPASKLEEKPSALKREHTALQKMKFMNFFYFVCDNFCLAESGSNPDPDPNPQHW
jgi:hypothetical protein